MATGRLLTGREDAMRTAELTIRLPEEDIEFAREYARTHDLSIADLIDRHLRDLRIRKLNGIHPEVDRISGILSAEIDARTEYREHLLTKLHP